MPPTFGNPYPDDRAEHRLWQQWHRAFFDEPVHAQLYEIESELRHSITALLRAGERIDAAEIREDIRNVILQLEHTALMLTESAEHAYMRVVTAPQVDSNGKVPGR